MSLATDSVLFHCLVRASIRAIAPERLLETKTEPTPVTQPPVAVEPPKKAGDERPPTRRT